MNTLRLMLRMLARDLRAGELGVLFLALLLAITALTSVAFLGDRMSRAVAREAHQLLGGDLLLSADHPWPDEFRMAAREEGLRLAESVSFLSMVSSGAGMQLAEVMAVSADYPLRGTLRTAPARNVGDGETAAPPAPGTLWPDERLAAALTVEVGDRLRVGTLELPVGALLTLSPDRALNPLAVAPRLMMSLADLDATGLVQPGSRIVWRLHVAGAAETVERYRQWAAARLGRGERLETLDNARPEVRLLVERAERFLRLAAMLTVVLAAVAIGLAARRYLARHLDACAVMRCLGASQRRLLLIHGGEFALLGVAATLLGTLAGYLLHLALLAQLSGLMGAPLPAAGAAPWGWGAAVAAVLILGFVLPPLWQLKSVSTLRVLRREWSPAAPRLLFGTLAGLLALTALMVGMVGDLKLGLLICGGFGLALSVFAGAAWGLLALTRALAARLPAGPLRLGLLNLARRRAATLVQIIALASGLTTLLLLGVARQDLLDAWQGKIPADAPNRFVINIQPEQREAVADFFRMAGLPPPRLEPMVRGRLVAINGQSIAPSDFAGERARRLVEREFNLSSRADLPPGNEIVAGRWHGERRALEFSVEQGLAETLALKLGDRLTFEVAGQHFTAAITSLRKLDWDSLRVNFFVIAPAGTLDEQPTSYITSFHLPASHAELMTTLVREMPNLTVIDVAAVLRQLRATLEQVARAVELVFAFALFAGLSVMLAALAITSSERRHEMALLRALGAQRRQLSHIVVIEFAALGLLAGGLAGATATGLAWGLAQHVFQLAYRPNLTIVAVGAASGLALLGLISLGVARRATAHSVVEALRRL